MNAYSNFSKGKKGIAERRLRSKAFCKGFQEGFGAIALFSAPSSHPRSEATDATVAGAWRAVNDALGAAYEGETKDIGKNTRKAVTAD